jgi:nitrite reductase/ring-hydroxylating ferredoxin subunit
MAQMSRRNLIRLLATVSIAQIPLIAEAAAVPSITCSRVGQTIIWRNRKYTCIRVGKKLIWDKGFPLAPASPSPSATPRQPIQNGPIAIYSPPPQEFRVLKSADLKINEPKSVLNPSLSEPSRGYILIRRESSILAFTNRCTHEGQEVEVISGQLVCLRHLSYFDSGDGHVLSGPATRTLIQFTTTEHDGYVFVIDTP